MTDLTRTMALGLCAFTAGCGAAQAQQRDIAGPKATADQLREASAPINDGELTNQLVQGAQLLHEGQRTTAMKTLIAQLDREPARIDDKLVVTDAKGASVDNATLYARARAAVLVIGNLYKCGKCDDWHVGQASGFVISSNGLAITNHHVIDRADSTTLVAMTSDGRVHPITEVLAASKVDDLAVIRLAGSNFKHLPVARTVAPGDRVRVISHPDGFLYSLTAGIVSRTFVGNRSGQKTPVLQITADFAKGSSGAPVIDDRGAVVGVVSYTKSVHHDNGADRKRNLQMVFKNCTPSSRILDLLGKR